MLRFSAAQFAASPARGNNFVALGTFDGVHLGHQQLIREMVKAARRASLASAVITFRPHPLSVLSPAEAPEEILSFEDRARLIESLGVDALVTIPFTRTLADTTAEAFARDLLAGEFGSREVHVGFNFRFGASGRGDVSLLQALGERYGFAVRAQEAVTLEGEVISSTLIREKVRSGDVAGAARLLGRPHFVRGRVTPGAGRGRTLGFPTANLDVPSELLLPGKGVYATRVRLEDRLLASVSNLGTRPTFEGGRRVLETFILELDENLYGCELTVEFLAKIREERKFSSPEDLQARISKDIEIARRYFSPSPVVPLFVPGGGDGEDS